MESAQQIGTAFVERLAAKNFDAIKELLAPAIEVRALLPPGLESHSSREPFLQRLRDWFGDKPLTLVSSAVEPVAGRWHIAYRFQTELAGVPSTVEQQLFAAIGESGIESVDLLCSGFQPLPQRGETEVRVFDAGELGCADGLAQAFRAQLQAIPPGARLRVVTSDPAARADLPPLARMLGHEILDVSTQSDGRTAVLVERKQ